MPVFMQVAAICATGILYNSPAILAPPAAVLFLAANPCEPVQLDEQGETWVVESADATCPPVNLPNGVKVVLLKDTALELNVFNETGKLKRGEVYVKTYALPFEITNLGHVISPDLTVSISLQNNYDRLAVITSVEGETEVFACADENAICSNRHMYIVAQGETLALKPDGTWYAKRNAEGNWIYPKSGCQTAHGNSGAGIWLLAAMLLFLFRRKRM